jgi:hypothetical protein
MKSANDSSHDSTLAATRDGGKEGITDLLLMTMVTIN